MIATGLRGRPAKPYLRATFLRIWVASSLAPLYSKHMAELRHSVCALDCPDCCSVLVQVEEGKGTKLKGDPAHPITRGFLCAKVAQYLEREYHPHRLLHPLRRAGKKGEGHFVRISWEEAIGEIADRLQRIGRECGPEAVLPYSYAGTMGILNGAGMDRRFFHRFGASRLDRTICASTGSAALQMTLGVRTGTEPEQFAHSRCIIAWGTNILATNVHLWPFIVEARRNGAKFYVIDPLPTKTAQLADVHVAINPGSDGALALGLMHVIFREGLEDRQYLEKHCRDWEELREKANAYAPRRVAEWTGISEEQIEALARDYATLRPAAIRLNYGIQRSERGGRSVHAVSLLPAITGSWKEVGGGLQLTTSGGFPLNRSAVEMPELQMQSPLGREARILNMSELGKIVTDTLETGPLAPPVKGLVVYNSNPGAIAPNLNRVRQGLGRDDLFTVVLEQFQTDTADFADFVLPVTTFLEHTDLYFAYGHYYLQLARPVLEAPGECRSNVAIFRHLASACGFTDPCFAESEDTIIRQCLTSTHPHLEGIDLERLEKEKAIRLNVSAPGAPYLPHAEGGFQTPSRKCEFHPERIDYEPPRESRKGDMEIRKRYPIELITAKAANAMNSTFGHRDDLDTECGEIHLNLSDAESRSIVDGDGVRVFNGRGELRLRAQVSGAIKPGLASVPAVRWARRAADGESVNVLTTDRLNDLGGGPAFFSCLVEVEKIGG